MLFVRPDLRAVAPAVLDTALFDVDGVLIDTARSYRLAVIHATDRLVRTAQGLPDAPTPLLTPEDVALFKRAGGFNNDWHLTRMLTALWTARLREWRGTAAAALALEDWAERAATAAQARRGGLAWMHATFPAGAIPAADVARWAEDEFYWGAALIQQHYAHEPLYAPEAAGFVHNEELLLPANLLPALLDADMHRLGLITGRVGPEVGWAVARLVAGCGLVADPAWRDGPGGPSPFAVIVSGEAFAKPDPAALAHAVRALGARGAVFIGDTADDLDLVLRYRAELLPRNAGLPPCVAVVIASREDAPVFAARGADVVIEHVRELPRVIAALRAARA
ncbi:MAG TPA: HAD family hydrolase [Ktedonobacterales bacterium]|nr:HAD family hydrolase [Ktedonobacterales bacterium]